MKKSEMENLINDDFDSSLSDESENESSSKPDSKPDNEPDSEPEKQSKKFEIDQWWIW